MIDFMWEHTSDLLPGFNWDWPAFGYPVDPLTVDRVALWAFRGDPQLAVGLTAVLASTLGWLNTAKTIQVIAPATYQADPVRRTPNMTTVDPTITMPFVVNQIAQVWGELADQTLSVHFQAADGERTHWTLTGDLAAIVQQLLDLSMEIQRRLGIAAPRRPDEPLDLHDPTLLADFVRAWGELLISAQFLPLGQPEFTQAVMQAVDQLQAATLVGSRFACWGACHALSTAMAQPHPAETDENAVIEHCHSVLLNLGTLFSTVTWPLILLSILSLEDDEVEQAIALCESAVESDPLAVIGWRLLITLYDLDEQYTQAIATCHEAIAGELADGPLYFQLGTLYYGLFLTSGMDDDAEHVQTAADDTEALTNAREAFLRADQLGFHEPEMYSLLMDIAQAIGDTDLLWTALRSLAEADTEGTWLVSAISFAGEAEDFEPGLTILREVSASHPDRFAVVIAYILALIGLERHTEAEQEIPHLRQLATTDTERVEAAALALETADPEFADSFETLDNELANGMVADAGATSYLLEILAREPLFADAAIALATAYESRQEIESAVAVLEKARQQLPGYSELLLSEADVLWGDDRDEDAVALLMASLNQSKPDAAVVARLSEYYLLSDDPIQALLYLNTALMLDPFDAEVERVSEQVVTEMEEGLASGAFDDDGAGDDYDDS